jgi:REP element-mobilizing transposase RayT
MNRAVARRTMFEHAADIAFFLDRVGETVTAGLLEVHAFTVLTTHFHMLVRSPAGDMSRAMYLIQLPYVRRFNRQRRRDGPLLRGRFRAKLVESMSYRRLLVAYIDANPVKAGLVAAAPDYPFGSCQAYVHGAGPAWLCRDWIHAETRATHAVDGFDGRLYADTFLRCFGEDHWRLVARRLRAPEGKRDQVDSLLRGVPAAVLSWFRYKAALADGTAPGMPLVPASLIAKLLRDANAAVLRDPSGSDRGAGRRQSIQALLLRHLAGLTFAEIGRCLGTAAEGARRRVHEAERELLADPVLAAGVADLGRAALAATWQPFTGAGDANPAEAPL